MNLLKKLLATVLPSSAEVSAEEMSRRAMLPREPRARVTPLLHVRFNVREPLDLPGLHVANLSISGVAILLPRHAPDGALPRPGGLLEGALDFNGHLCLVKARIVHQSAQVLGCSFEGDTSELTQMIRRYFEVELTALSMIATPEHVLQTEPDGTPHWHHGSNGCELYYVTRADRLVRYNLSFFGNYLESMGGALRYGHVIEDEETDKPRYKGSALIHWQTSLPREIRDTALRFIENIGSLPKGIRDQLTENLTR